MSRRTLLCGHQPGFHHPGILAKRVTQHARATAEGVESTWILVDQDVGDPGAIRYPDRNEKGELVDRTWHVTRHEKGHPTGTAPWTDAPSEPPDVSPDMPASVSRGLQEIHDSLHAAEGESLAERFHDAQERLLQRRLEDMVGPAPTPLRATTILRTEAGRSILSSILEAPEDCALAWNRAGTLVPRAARALRIDRIDPLRTEIPCWTLDEAGRRIPATVEDLRRYLDGEGVLHPRAFLMTAVARSSSSLPMIHGTGGGRYELVTDRWASEFLGLELPPVSVCTADLRLPLEAPEGESEEIDPHEALRRLEHDPWPGETTKRDLAEAIRLAPRRSAKRRRLFDALQAALSSERSRLGSRLDTLRERSLARNLHSGQRRVAAERTWPWPLHEDDALRRLPLRMQEPET